MHWGAEVNRYRATRHLKGWMVAAAILTEIGGPFVTPVEALAATPANVEQTLVDRPGAEFLGSSSSSDKSREESHSEASPAAAEVPESETAVTDAEATNETATMESTDKPKKPDTPRPTSAKSKRPREASKPATESIDQWMPNKRLQRAIFYQLTHLSPVPDDDKTWQTVADITKDDMQRLQKLFIGYYGGENGESTYNPDGKQYRLDGLEYATNLEVLMMGGGGQDAEPYQNFGNIEDISPLRNLRKLKTVYLSHNRISDVSPLAGLTNISDLKLHDNRITDFSSLKNLSVKVNEERIHQYVILDPIRVNSLTRKVHLDIPVRLQTGELLTGVNQNLEYTFSVPYYTGDSEYGDGKLVYAWYFQGGQVTDNGSGGLDFTHIVDQTEGGQFDESIQMDDNNYLIAEYVKDHYSFWIIQKYYIGDAAESVTVNYQDEQGHKLAATQILQGDIGDTYQAETVTIPGYELTKVPDNAQGTFGEEAITVTYVYRKLAPEPPVTPPTPNPQPAPNPTPTPGPTPILPPIKQGRVTVHYQTVAGMPVHGDTSVTGQVGQAYETRPLSLAGYHVVGRSTTATGIFGEQPVDVTYTYAANVVTGGQGDGTESEEPAVSTGNETSAGSGQISQPTATLPIHTGSAFATAMKPGEQPVALPATNERATPFRWLGWLGWVVLVAGLGGWWFKRRRQ